MLATKSDNHDIYKREAIEEPSTTVLPTDEPMNENFLYFEQGVYFLNFYEITTFSST